MDFPTSFLHAANSDGEEDLQSAGMNAATSLARHHRQFFQPIRGAILSFVYNAMLHNNDFLFVPQDPDQDDHDRVHACQHRVHNDQARRVHCLG